MESYTLIDLLDGEEQDEDLEDDELEIKKKRRLADLIINFITDKDSDNQQEEDILTLLFEAPTNGQTKQVELLSGKIEPEVVARVVVETRINDLTKELTDIEDVDTRKEQIEKIQELQEIRSYLMIQGPEPEIVTTEKEEIEEFVVIDEIKETTTTKTVSEYAKPIPTTEGIIRREQPTRKPHLFESNRSQQPKKNFRHELSSKQDASEQKPRIPTKSLSATRELINRLYEKPKITPKIEDFKQPIMPKEQYHNFVNKNVPDIEVIKKLLQKNNFDLAAQQKIISEILAGGDPETAIERQLKNNEKTLGQTSAYIHRTNDKSRVAPQSFEEDLPKTKADIVRKPSKPLSSNPRLWAILIVLIILIGIIFRVI